MVIHINKRILQEFFGLIYGPLLFSFFLPYLKEIKTSTAYFKFYQNNKNSIIHLNKEFNTTKTGPAIFFVENPQYPLIIDKDFQYEVRAACYKRLTHYLTLKMSFFPQLSYITTWRPVNDFINGNTNCFYSRPFLYNHILLSGTLFSKETCKKPSNLEKLGNNYDNYIYDSDYQKNIEDDIVNIGRKRIQFYEFSYDNFTILAYYNDGKLSHIKYDDEIELGEATPGNKTFWDFIYEQNEARQKRITKYKLKCLIISTLCFIFMFYEAQTIVLSLAVIAILNLYTLRSYHIYRSMFFQDCEVF